MVEAGEKSGSLTWVFQQLYDLIQKRQRLKKQLLTALTYPAFLGGFCFFIVIALLLFVIPSMRELFEDRQLHPLTMVVLSLSQFLETSLVPCVIGVGSVVCGIVYFFQRKGGKILLHKFLQKVPIVKTVLLQAALVRFSRSASILLYGGVPLPAALHTSGKVMNHALLEKEIQEAEKQIIEGKRLSHLLQGSNYFPPLVGRMLSIAEETGKMPEMLHSLSDIYDEELERSLSQITTLLQPILLLIVGGIVGLVVLSILLPLTDVSSLT